MSKQPEAIDPPDEQDILATIRPKKRWGRRLLLALLAAIALLAVIALLVGDKEEPTRYLTEQVDRGDIELSATSTGNLEPRRTVPVGAEVSGKVTEVLVEENEHVTQGQLLARIDLSRVDNERAQLRAQRAGALASVDRVRATQDELDLSVERARTLVERGASPQSALDQLLAQRARSQADLAAARADLSRVRASLAALEADVERATITSPVDGVVLERAVEPGSTVAASFQAPQLFLIAEDLSRMELHVLINEADVSLLEPGQAATFRVDAWPQREFTAVVQSVSLNPTLTNNVVSYKTVLSVDNAERLLRPGMTATTVIQTGRREDVLRAPLQALWFEPPEQTEGFTLQIGPERRDRTEKRGSSMYVLRQGEPKKINVELGRSDASHIEILSGDLKQGDALVLGIEEAEESDQEPDEKAL